MDVVFVVVGCAGEYSDRREWFVAAYPDAAAAMRHAQAATGKAQELKALGLEEKNPHDPHSEGDGYAADYTVVDVPVMKEFPWSGELAMAGVRVGSIKYVECFTTASAGS